MTRVHYDRLPWLPRGRHGSRVQKANHHRRREWRQAKNDVHNWQHTVRLQLPNGNPNRGQEQR